MCISGIGSTFIQWLKWNLQNWDRTSHTWKSTAGTHIHNGRAYYAFNSVTELVAVQPKNKHTMVEVSCEGADLKDPPETGL